MSTHMHSPRLRMYMSKVAHGAGRKHALAAALAARPDAFRRRLVARGGSFGGVAGCRWGVDEWHFMFVCVCVCVVAESVEDTDTGRGLLFNGPRTYYISPVLVCIYIHVCMPAFVFFTRPAIKHVFYPGIELYIHVYIPGGIHTTSPVSAAARCVRVHTYIQSVVFPLRPAVLHALLSILRVFTDRVIFHDIYVPSCALIYTARVTPRHRGKRNQNTKSELLSIKRATQDALSRRPT